MLINSTNYALETKQVIEVGERERGQKKLMRGIGGLGFYKIAECRNDG